MARTIVDEIIAIIRDEANNNPAPTIGTVTKIYTDDYVDVTTDTGDYRYVKIIGDKVIGNEGILVFIDGELDNQYFLSSTEVTSITIDDSLSNISTNPVQNKVINTALGNKVDKETGKGLFSGSYTDLTDKPFIPSKTSDLSNDSNFISTSNTAGLIKNDGTIDQTQYSTFTGSYDDLSNKPSIPSKTSDLTNDSNFISTSATVGLIKNDGSIDTTQYSTFSGNYTDLTNKPTIPTDVSELTDNYNTAFTPKSHNHTKSDITDFPTLSTVATSGNYNDLSNKPNIPSKISDLTNDSNFIETSNTSGLIKNDGSIDTTTYSTFSGSYNDLSNKPSIPSKTSDLTNDSDFISTSNTSGLIKNDGSIDTTSYSTFSGSYNDLSNKPSIPSDISDLSDTQSIIPTDVSDLTDTQNTAFTPKTHTHSEYVNPTIADNLTTNDATQVLSAKQGKVLNDLIGQAITYINQ